MTRSQKIMAILIGKISVLSGVALWQMYGLGQDYALPHQMPGHNKSGNTHLDLEREVVQMDSYDTYVEILDRPLFNDSRTPEEDDAVLAETEADEPVVEPLKAELSGIIIAGETQIAMVKNPESGEVLPVKLGQPLTGDQAGWTLKELSPRMAVFAGATQEEQELTLETDVKGAVAVITPPKVNNNKSSNPNKNARPSPLERRLRSGVPQEEEGNPENNPISAEEIRQRIEERRRQLREEAQRINEQQN